MFYNSEQTVVLKKVLPTFERAIKCLFECLTKLQSNSAEKLQFASIFKAFFNRF